MDRTAPMIVADDAGSLYQREWLPMVRLATVLLGSAALAEEVVQDAFAEVEERWPSLGNPGGYLRTCVVNGCRMVLRRRDLERERCTELGNRPGAGTTEMPTNLVELRAALEQLGERQRVVIVLRYFVDLPDREIAEILECRPATVRSLARRALRVLREELQ